MDGNDKKARVITWLAVGVFSFICFVTFIAFQPTRKLICGHYELDGVERLLALIRGSDASCFWGVLYDFQTLLTGLLAVAAASAAVIMSSKTEQQNAIRHQSNVELTLRPDKLRIERMLIPHLRRLKDITKTLQSTYWSQPFGLKEVEILDALLVHGNQVKFALRALIELTEHQYWIQAADLLDGKTTDARNRINRLAKRQLKLTDFGVSDSFKRSQGDNAAHVIYEQLSEAERIHLQLVPQIHNHIVRYSVELRDRLQSLASIYRIEL